MNKQDWEILDPKIHKIIDDLNSNIEYLTLENKKLNDTVIILKNEIQKTNIIINEQKHYLMILKFRENS